jgi:hypothetical protein
MPGSVIGPTFPDAITRVKLRDRRYLLHLVPFKGPWTARVLEGKLGQQVTALV